LIIGRKALNWLGRQCEVADPTRFSIEALSSETIVLLSEKELPSFGAWGILPDGAGDVGANVWRAGLIE
jgi:hypothetical protein